MNNTEAKKPMTIFRWITKDGKRHHKMICDDNEHYQERLDFIHWLETDPDVVSWR